ncbi:uncharacterized protein K452DRAFT_329496 [Aplosporella prunicola CBS 121167]|uniref:Amino acid permease/ SLC12A domain-containing protein n=1 Tax=Aplosporella prunicola CBS 121167 TaxID=1176127 RepID=A0A6A6AZ50_9PEZI|nr:uncharacterized protein K452DRAFT_329496 [Aplosporella prunicola CBS 121167]KAF2136916.1 hypothetical protein K452DRAFT_329496 [Aplosporella prunicola CBS 121167]
MQPRTSTTLRHAGTTKRGLKSRHTQMIAIGGTIGTSLFVGTGLALSVGGLVFLFLAYIVITIPVYGILTATTEISAYMPLAGSTMSAYASRFVSPSLGFAMGWLYWYSFAIGVPIGVWITTMFIVIVGLNFFSVSVYGETEFWFASLKVFMIVGFLILSFILFWGGGPSHQRLGFHYWKEQPKTYLVDGPTATPAVSVFLVFSFNFAPELLVITSGEMKAPRRNIPTAAKMFFYLLLVFYIGGSLAVGMLQMRSILSILSSS